MKAPGVRFGRELAADPGLSALERLYVRIWGIPVQGLRVRARNVLPEISADSAPLLDAGCGRGAFVLHLAGREFPFALGIDTDVDRLRRARGAASGNRLGSAHWAAMDLLRPGLRTRFRTILSVDNLEHIDDDQGAVDALAKLLAPGGRLIVHVPALTRRWLLFRWQENFDAPGHVRPGYEPVRLREILERAGLSVVELRYTYGLLETLANNLSYLITGARERNRGFYALAFPVLLFLTWLGSGARPSRGAGLLAVATR